MWASAQTGGGCDIRIPDAVALAARDAFKADHS